MPWGIGFDHIAVMSVIIENEETLMDITLILKVAGVGILVSVASQILSKYGRDDQSVFVGIAGIIVVLLMLVGELGELFDAVCDAFGL
jgi:stage III sporulation protein AC